MNNTLKLEKTKDNLYILHCSFEQRAIAKKYGFKWHNKLKKWTTDNWYLADKIINSEGLPSDNSSFHQPNTTGHITFNKVKTDHLFPYQVEGLKGLINNKNVLLADEQGLGKTIQAIELLNSVRPRRTLIICPSSLKLNWARELERWMVYKKQLCTQIVNSGKDPIDLDCKIIIINYDLLSKPYIQQQLIAYNPDVAICDEAHYLKNAKSARTKATFKIIKNADRKIMITGTPMTNRPIELYPILKEISPKTIEPYNDYRKYAYKFCNAFDGLWGFDVSGYSNIKELNYRLRKTCMIRRLKVDVLKELPDKTIQLIPLEQNKDTKAIVRKEAQFDIEDLSKQPKLGDIGELSKIRQQLAIAKLPQAIKHIEDMLESVNKIVVFAYHVEIISKLKEALDKYMPAMVVGGMADRAKQQNIDTFQGCKDCRVFIGNIQAAGVGITLTAASHVVFVETTWTPGDLHQAIDRCHRIGQKDNVSAQFLVVQNSLDESMLKIIFDKQLNINKILE